MKKNICVGDTRLHPWTEDAWQTRGADGVLTGLLGHWSLNSPTRLVLMLDEVDALDRTDAGGHPDGRGTGRRPPISGGSGSAAAR